MLQRLSIQNFVLIEELSIEFYPHFSVITGETGAGKSIILGAIALLMGQRADSGTLLPGAERCIIEAQFTDLDTAVARMLEEEDIDADEGECIVRREITSKGKSRAFINDTPASQHQNLLLGDAQFQLSTLDLYRGEDQLVSRYQELYETYKSKAEELNKLRQSMEALWKEEDYLRFQYDQLEEADLEEGELQELVDEERQLAHAQEIKEALQRATSALSDEEQGALPALTFALKALESIRNYHTSAEEWYDRLSSIRIDVQDLTSTLEEEASSVTFSPKRLARVEERLDLIRGLLHKHSLQDVSELILLKERLSEELDKIQSSDEDLARLEAEEATCYTALLEAGAELSASRQEAARAIEEQLISSLHELGMPHVRFHIHIDSLQHPTRMGLDHVTFLFSANRDIAPEPVADIASGGEVSRLMLALKALIADKRSLPTIIFDEIDTGVSGETAERIAKILRRMGQSMQVMAVTHLPQIAAAGEERIDEIARMQSGSTLTEVTRAAAQALLSSFAED